MLRRIVGPEMIASDRYDAKTRYSYCATAVLAEFKSASQNYSPKKDLSCLVTLVYIVVTVAIHTPNDTV